MNQLARPWYREPFVWLLIGFPLTSVVVGITLYVIAAQNQDGLVQDDYYKKGKEINLTLARDQAAIQAGLHGSLQLDAASQQVLVELAAKNTGQLPQEITLRWLHATRAGFDRMQTLQRNTHGRYSAEFPDLAPGHWYLQLEAQNWRVQGSLRVPKETRAILKPSAIAGEVASD